MAAEYFDERMETLPPDVLRRVQDHRLHWQFRRCWDGSAFYRARFEAAGLTPETFRGLADLERLPLQTRSELEAVDPLTWLVAPAEWVTQWKRSASFVRQQSLGDVRHEQDRYARSYWAAGAQSPYYSLVAGSAPHIQRRFGPPTVDPAHRVSVRSLRDPVAGMYLAYRCTRGKGRHWAADHMLPEIVDPASGRAVPGTSLGELVVTDLVREAHPLFRYRTGLEAWLTDEPCGCGRTGVRVLRAQRRPARR